MMTAHVSCDLKVSQSAVVTKVKLQQSIKLDESSDPTYKIQDTTSADQHVE